MSNFFNITDDTIHFGSDGAFMSAGDVIFVASGIELAGLNSGATTGSLFNGIQSTATTAGITATINGFVVGSYDGISIDNIGSSSITVGKDGSITSIFGGGAPPHAGDGVFLGGGGNFLRNNGEISGPADGVDIKGTGNNTIVNNGAIDSNQHAVHVTGDGNTITNTGEMSGGSASAVLWSDVSSVGEASVFITNSGQITGGTAIELDGSGSDDVVNNSGTLSATVDAISVQGGNGLRVNNSGTIDAAGYAVHFDSENGSDLLVNSGNIRGDIREFGAGPFITILNSGLLVGEIELGDRAFVTNTASGTIASTHGGLELGIQGTVQNDGDITCGISTLNALSITNGGTISNSFRAINIDGGNSKIINTGDISSGGTTILFDGADFDDHGNSVILNSGKISGSIAIQLLAVSGDVDTIHNSGTISGVTMAVSEQGSGGTLHIVNTGHIVGDIDFGNGANLYNGTLGSIDGVVNGGAGEDTIKGGADGETLNGAGGSDLIKGGAGDDVIDGGTGADKLVGGGGNDTFVYTGVSDSKGVGTHDTIVGFDALSDTFDFEVAVTGVGQAITAGTLNQAAFNVDLQAIVTATALHAHGAVLVTPNAGDLAGHTYLVIDDNGTAGYQAATDYVIELSQGVHLASLSASNFI